MAGKANEVVNVDPILRGLVCVGSSHNGPSLWRAII